MKIRHPWLTHAAAFSAVTACKLLFSSLRIQFAEDSLWLQGYAPDAARKYLYCIWHDSLLVPIFAGKPQKMAALVSQHQDGSYLAESMERVGIKCVRGSSRRGGVQAMREMFDVAREYHITITPDGPRGPRRQVKDGIVYLASRTGNAIVPVAAACRRSWRVRGSWTDMLVPQPFAEVCGVAGEAIEVPRRLGRGELAAYTAQLQAAMDHVNAEAERRVFGAAAITTPSSQRAAA